MARQARQWKKKGEMIDRTIGIILAVALIITFMAVLIYVLKRAIG